MDAPVEYRMINKGDVHQVSLFVESVFNQFVAPELIREGIDEFLKYIQPDTLVNHLEKNHFGILASINAIIIGTIVIRDYNHVALFFVDAQHQRKGIGKELFNRALKHCSSRDFNNSQITVNSSPNSVNAYRNLNFEPTGKEQCVSGIRFVPMVLRL